MTSARTRVYTDGACSGNPGPGGWAWVVPNGPWAAGPAAQTTNQRMELQAVLDAVERLDGPLHIVSDSTYVVNCFRDSWWKGWLKRGWKNSKKEPVANRDLWEPLVELYQERDVTFEWVKGHSGDEWNDVADRLAVEAGQTQRDRRGDGMPDALGPADEIPGAVSPAGSPRAGSAGEGRPAADPTGRNAPPGHLVVVGGHRPPEIGGWDDNPTAQAIRRRLGDVLAAKAQMHDDLVVVTGLGLGAEQLAAEAAMDVDVPFVGVLAFPDPSAVWPKPSQERFDALLDAAQDVIVLQAKVPESKAKIGGALKRRDAWFGRNAAEAVIVWDRSERFVGNLVRSLESALGDEVWIVDPAEV